MKQAEIDRAVARATGETVSTVKRLGFLLAEPDGSLHADSEDDEIYTSDIYIIDSDNSDPYVIDWDELEAQRGKENTRRPRDEPVAV